MNTNLAHVKWFTTVPPGAPASLTAVLTPPFLAGFALTVAAALLFTVLNQPLQRLDWVAEIHRRLERLKPHAPWIMRVGVAIPLIGAALGNYLLFYELSPAPLWLRGAQALIGLLLLIPRMPARWPATAGILLYVAGMALFGLHNLLDYVAWLGACFYLMVAGTGSAGYAIPALYITTAWSLIWAAAEKWVYPHMALDVLTRAGIPTFGFAPEVFLLLSGWVEFGVAYLLLTGVLNRFLSLVVTMLFVTTTMVFGPKEILGHWILHATLLVFLVEGTGPYITPVLWHRGTLLQMLFVGVTLIPLTLGTLWLYIALAP